MRLRLLIANHAEVQNGLLYIAGGAWTEIGPEPSPFAVAAAIDVPWDETNRRSMLEITIVDADEKPVTVRTPEGKEQPLKVIAHFEVGRPAGGPVGRWFTVAMAMNLGPVPLPPGKSLILRGMIGGKVLDEVRFQTRPAQKG